MTLGTSDNLVRQVPEELKGIRATEDSTPGNVTTILARTDYAPPSVLAVSTDFVRGCSCSYCMGTVSNKRISKKSPGMEEDNS